MRPTVITGLSDNTRCMQEEIFGERGQRNYFTSQTSFLNGRLSLMCAIKYTLIGYRLVNSARSLYEISFCFYRSSSGDCTI